MSNPLDIFMAKKSVKKVEDLSEALRICNLPEYTPREEDHTERYRIAGSTWSLRPVQNKALTTARDAGGLVGLIGCGAGKTLISFLLPNVMGSKRPLILLPAALVAKTLIEVETYREHFYIPHFKVISYERLSRPSGVEELTKYEPDLIICDEAHKLKSLASTRTKRLGKYLFEHPECKLVVMSGTLLNKSLHDLAHLTEWVLEEGSPLPRNPREVEQLDQVIKGEADRYAYARFKPLIAGAKPREALLERLRTTRGVVITDTETVQSSLRIQTKRLKMPDELVTAITTCFEEGVVEGLGEYIDPTILLESDHLWDGDDAFALRGLAQLAMGCLYYWNWGGNRDNEWLNARRNWRRAIRNLLEWQDEFDSPALIEENWEYVDGAEEWEEERNNWLMVKHRPEPPKAQEWVSDYMIDAIRELLEPGTIVWVGLSAVGERLATELNITYYPGGSTPELNGESCIMSIKSHGTGLNLQMWSKNIIAHPIADPSTWEQLIARTHRTGQPEDEVTVTVFTHSVFGSALSKARKQAKVITEATSQPQRLAYADWITL